MTNARLIAGLSRAADSSPDDTSVRLHLAELLLATGQPFESVPHVAAVLAREPACAHAQVLMAEALSQLAPTTDPGTRREPEDVVPPAMDTDVDLAGDMVDSPYDVEEPRARLSDVGGMAEVKKRLEAGFLAPMRNPQLRRVYGTGLRGGLLLYGPPGCDKAFLARALAGEMAARFLAVSLPEVLDTQEGQSERNLEDIFDLARRHAPCVLFLDEIDALGDNRTTLRSSRRRATVNQLLTEMDGVGHADDGVFVLGATNHPWDVAEALSRPGRFDRTLLVVPPDEPAMPDVADLDAARRGTEPSLQSWLESASRAALVANGEGKYDDLLGYLRRRRLPV